MFHYSDSVFCESTDGQILQLEQLNRIILLIDSLHHYSNLKFKNLIEGDIKIDLDPIYKWRTIANWTFGCSPQNKYPIDQMFNQTYKITETISFTRVARIEWS